ncbi:MAG: hypothetical protein ACYDAY_10680 [Candidatus Dormibacteria bacterium]
MANHTGSDMDWAREPRHFVSFGVKVVEEGTHQVRLTSTPPPIENPGSALVPAISHVERGTETGD